MTFTTLPAVTRGFLGWLMSDVVLLKSLVLVCPQVDLAATDLDEPGLTFLTEPRLGKSRHGKTLQLGPWKHPGELKGSPLAPGQCQLVGGVSLPRSVPEQFIVAVSQYPRQEANYPGNSLGKVATPETGGAGGGALADPRLSRIAQLWPSLSETTRLIITQLAGKRAFAFNDGADGTAGQRAARAGRAFGATRWRGHTVRFFVDDGSVAPRNGSTSVAARGRGCGFCQPLVRDRSGSPVHKNRSYLDFPYFPTSHWSSWSAGPLCPTWPAIPPWPRGG